MSQVRMSWSASLPPQSPGTPEGGDPDVMRTAGVLPGRATRAPRWLLHAVLFGFMFGVAILVRNSPSTPARLQALVSTTLYRQADPADPPGFSFPLGVFEAGNVMSPTSFEALIRDTTARGFDTVLFTGNGLRFHLPLLDISDRLGFNVIWAPMHELDASWWSRRGAVTLDDALLVAQPTVDAISSHPSVKGYNVADEPGIDARRRLALMTEAFQQLDPSRLVTAVLAGLDRAEPLYSAARPDVLLIDVYPVGGRNAPCDFTMTGFGYSDVDFVEYVREVTRSRPPGVPLWFVLQAHSFDPGGRFWLREPTVAEVRLEQWLAVGEGAQGIFWFIYSSQQGWRGLRDNPVLFDEITDLTRRLGPLRPTLRGAHRIDDEVSLDQGAAGYVSTLTGPSGQRFVVVANPSCSDSNALAITSSMWTGQLRDLESGDAVPFGQPITLRPGDGRIFKIEGAPATPSGA
jgi:hypothetical protein